MTEPHWRFARITAAIHGWGKSKEEAFATVLAILLKDAYDRGVEHGRTQPVIAEGADA